MFICITGEPGSGKSAYAVDFVLKHEKEYKNIYVNINGFNLRDNINALNYPELYQILSCCKDIYDTQIENLGLIGDNNSIDEPIKNYLIEKGFISINPEHEKYLKALEERSKESSLKQTYLNITSSIEKVPLYLPTLIVMDEAQNHMGAIDPVTGKELRTADPILAWWVSYHRHLYMDVLILAQQYQKIHIAYRRDVGYFLHGIASQSLFFGKHSKSLVYKKYKESPYQKSNETGLEKVKKRPELFAAYQSGDAVRSKSVLLPWFIFSGALLLVVSVMFYFISKRFSNDVNDSNVTATAPEIVRSIVGSRVIIKEDNDFQDFTYIKLNCVDTVCQNTQHSINLNIADLNATVIHTKSKFLSVDLKGLHFASIYILASRNFLNLFQGANHAEKNKEGFSILN